MPSQAAFNTILRRNGSELQRLVDELARGTLTAEEFGDRAYDALARGHADAYSAGMRHAGTTLDPLTVQTLAEHHGRAIADAENAWLDKFVADLEDGRYTDEEGNLKIRSVTTRANMYAYKLRATSAQGFVDGSDPDEQFAWVMGALEHCKDCPRMAALSPYYAYELFTMPGQGDTECLAHCQCHLVRLSDGKTSFKHISLT